MLLSRRSLFASLAAGLLLVGVACSDANNEPAPTAADTPAAVDNLDFDPTSDGGSAAPAATQAGQFTIPELVDYAAPAIVRIQGAGSVGTGFVIDSDGYIVTNNHVIEAAAERNAPIDVEIWDGDILEAELVGRDARADLALLKVDPVEGMVALPLTTEDQVIVGETAVAFGFPLDLEMGDGASFTVTSGIISAKNRAIRSNPQVLGAIQHDAPITNGNSGGPLINLRGEVVGVNTAVALNENFNAQASGIGFAVGADTVNAVINELREFGAVQRAYLGISNFDAVRPAQARDLDIPEDLGGIVAGAVPADGPVGNAGLETGDVIVEIGGFEIGNEAELAVALTILDPGDLVDVVIYRDGARLTLEVTLGDAAQL